MPEVSARPASFAQKRLWFLEQFDPGSSAYNLPRAFRITGSLNLKALEEALTAVVARHESLRTTFNAIDGDPVQVVHPFDEPFPIPVINLEEVPEDKRHEQAVAIAAEEGQRPFDLGAGPLLRAMVLRFSHLDFVFVLTLHHIVADGWSMSILFEEISEFYNAFSSNRLPTLPELSIQYSDFACWQRECLQGEALGQEVQFWKQALEGAPELLNLPADRPRPPVQSHHGRKYCASLDSELAEQLKVMSMASRVTLSMTLLAAFEVLLWRYTAVDTLVIGTPVAGRTEVELERLIGLFVNTLPLRADLAGDLSFRDLFQRVRSCTLEAFAHQNIPFEKLVEELQPERSLSYTPLFQVMFVFQNMPRSSLQWSGTRLEEIELDHGFAKFDLTLEIIEMDGLYCTWEYNRDLFDEERIARMTGHFETLLRGILANPDQKLSELPILTPLEQKQILVDWNATQANYPRETSIHEAFEERVEQCSDEVAIFSENRNVTFAQLNYEANALANHLRQKGLTIHARVGVFLERSVDAIVALLAVMKAGAGFVPIDPSYPKRRVAFMLKDSNAAALITQQRLRGRLPEYRGTIVYLDGDRSEIISKSTSNLKIPVDSIDPAYVIYTSGSTGEPKGVIATHRACMNRFAWMWNTYPFKNGEVCAQRTSLSFVDSIWEIFGPLLQGVPLSIVPEQVMQDPEQLVRHLAAHRISRIVLVPSVLESLLDLRPDLPEHLSHLRLCVSSGEALPYGLYERFKKALPQVNLINLYGSSEVAADVTCFDTRKIEPSGVIPIGTPIANVRIYILDGNFNPVPVGIPGEIYVGGDCLALGYLERPKLTAERFLTIPIGTQAPERLYRTGDLGRYRPDGNIEFLGRTDRQVKLRGIRIELGEIESVLASHPSVHQAVVIAKEEGTPNHRLVAYVKPRDGQAVRESELRLHLKARLSEPMIPSAFVTLAAIPLTPNGKLDPHALPPIKAGCTDFESEYVPPRNATEKSLAEIWSELLGVDRIGMHDNFFELGGHSLTAARVIARIRRSLQVEVAVRTLFEEPTVAGLAAEVEKARVNGAFKRRPVLTSVVSARDSLRPQASLVPMQPNGVLPPLFIVPGSTGDVLGYAELPRLLDSEQPVFGLQFPGLHGECKPLERIEEMAEHFLREITKLYPRGPYQLAGFCIGGIVAFEIAQRLIARGEEVSLLALIETWPPTSIPAPPDTPVVRRRFTAFAAAVRRHLGALLNLPALEAFHYLRDKIRHAALQSHADLSHQSEHYKQLVTNAIFSAALRYVPCRYPGRILLFIPTEGDFEIDRTDPRLVWGRLAEKGSRVIRVSGNRGNLLNRPHVHLLATKLTEELHESGYRVPAQIAVG